MVEKLTRDSTDSMIVHALNLCSDISEAKGNTSDFSRFVRISGTGNIMYELSCNFLFDTMSYYNGVH